MGQFIFKETEIKGVYIIEPKVFEDNRGYFMETYNYKDFKKAGLDINFVQDNQSKSKKGVLRGLHYQNPKPQGKLIRVISGEIFDVAVDLRKSSPTYGKWVSVILSEKNKKQFYIPEGFAHGFLVLSEEAEITYKCTEYYYPEYEGSIAWNDPRLSINWPIRDIKEVILSNKDKNALTLKEHNVIFTEY
ncbi:dTDP-4-dehydrorhamnose 3,5-epimerase [Clostridium sp. SYSU_GA19001]|uniref:dTDP-4-dehydrorhamnose 3,5-epimerase n=1 Tax=Clostridium caldaquaticum TaxID=2940653 RepID=UPI0020770B9E|nr:dTDP-4-dehydrorhamnose 3,5-epimerase [Clostridium caldaquaticum]MCM8709418.1 dTDP-4-dehydrorhamnose 3,5-epimerase [Clostridium caldaquaticum]